MTEPTTASFPAESISRSKTWKSPYTRLVGWFIVWLGLPYLPLPEFWMIQLNYVGLAALVAMGIVLLTGVGGLISFGQAAFVGIGAYATAFATVKLGMSPFAGLGIGMLITLGCSLVLGWITLRMSGHYLPLATICWCLALFYTMGNLDGLGKYDGIVGLPAISVGSWIFDQADEMFHLIWAFVGVAALALVHLLDSRPGRVMRALSGNNGGGDLMPEAMGASAFRAKLTMFVIAALLASIAGWLFAHMQRTVNPSPFGLNTGIQYLLMAVLGGIGTVGGAIMGALFVRLAEDQLQVLLPRLFGTSGNYEMIIFGILLVLMLRYAPRGLWPLVQSLFQHPRQTALPNAVQALPRREQPAAGRIVLRVEGLTRRFGGLLAVDAVSFQLAAGQILGLIGPNGAGKSTTFNLLSSVLEPSSGTVHFRDIKVSDKSSREVAMLGMSRTFQHVKLVAGMTVLENVALGAYTRGTNGALSAMLRLDRAAEQSVLQEAARQLTRIGLAPLMYRDAADLALGQQRLVEIARALASDPVLLLLDEPAAGLRHAEKNALANVLRQLRQEGISILLVEHDMDFLMNLTDRIVVMESGAKLAEGTPSDIQRDPKVRAAYLGAE